VSISFSRNKTEHLPAVVCWQTVKGDIIGSNN
jgi:hypothetical protein